MRPGPQKGSPAVALTYAEKAVAAWDEPPDWVAELAAYADAKGAKAAAKAIAYSPPVVSLIVNNKAGALDIGRIEQMVRGALMGSLVDCPVRGDMSRDICLSWQKKPYALSSAARVEMYQACRGGCPHSKLKGDADHE